MEEKKQGKIGKNIEFVITEDNHIILRIDLNKNEGISATGKSFVVAKSNGMKKIEGCGLYLNLALFKGMWKETKKTTKGEK